eukprot:TRINITY_DN13622_c0_g1_i1.p1 TRINITY_DN13622_c0_g1~~TRINITY_DN13622_c0_g1_i1.p1  ORF type:complete len:376 (+),score=52.93 TRINITY_DN13622_c0_g1_i1:180-1307(+)
MCIRDRYQRRVRGCSVFRMERRQGALSLLVLCAAFAFANAAPWSRVDEIVPESEEPDVTLATVPLVRQERSEETHRKLMDFIDLTHTRKVHPIRLIDETSHQRLVSEVTLQNADMVEYYGPVTIAGQTIKAVFDTGSGICWAASEECHMDACEAHTQLKVNKRVHLENGTVGIKYGTGHMSGLRASSLVQVGSVAVHDQDFLLSTHEYGDVFKNGVFDGVMGFGRINLANILRKPGDAEGRGDPFYMRAISQNLVATPQFSIYVSSKDDKPGAMVIGGTNKKLYNGKVTWHTGLSDSYWEVQLDGIRLEGQDSGTHDTMMLTDVTDGDDSHRKCRAIADSGTSLLVGPEHMIKPLLPYIKAVSYTHLTLPTKRIV